MKDRNVEELEPQARAAVRRRGSAGAAPLSLLVEAKLAVPSVRHGLVDRPRVRRALDAGGDAQLTARRCPGRVRQDD